MQAELIDYQIAANQGDTRLKSFSLSVAATDALTLKSDSIADANILLRALATIIHPVKGVYRFQGHPVDFASYRNLLPVKRKIGYIGPQAALISNKTIRENLLLMRYYAENTLRLHLRERTLDLCRRFELEAVLDRRPAEAGRLQVHQAIAIREIVKNPHILILERPEDFVGHDKIGVLRDLIAARHQAGTPVIFTSHDHDLNQEIATRQITLTGGCLQHASKRNKGGNATTIGVDFMPVDMR